MEISRSRPDEEQEPMTRNQTTVTTTVAATLVLVLAGCASTAAPKPADPSAASDQGYPVSVENCGRALTFDSAPQRVVSLWQAPTEMMLALGLRDRLVARAGDYADYPASVARQVGDVPSIGTSMSWPSKEVLLNEDPDLVLGQSLAGYAFDSSQGYASVEEIERGGAQVYGANVCDADGGDALRMTLDTPIRTLRDLGKIFGVSDRAHELIAQLESEKQAVVDAVKGKPNVKVAFYNGGEGPLIVLAGGIYDSAITTAGGTDVFPADSVYVSKEDFAVCDADVILVGTFTGQDFSTLRAYLVQTFPDLPAVKNGRIAEVPVADTDASISVMRGLTEIANGLHPGLNLPVPAS
ncbi:ABC transporter substrate-binding protein [Solwaraspora sp. WMMB335]|uniref:ABC transporter substrate-binding protein n=1 Tax=Solwaraspora sp. WMMB335 TaxID=3404118 RepID=UPI003B93988E